MMCDHKERLPTGLLITAHSVYGGNAKIEAAWCKLCNCIVVISSAPKPEIKACPFCFDAGAMGGLTAMMTSNNTYLVRCSNCHANGPDKENREDAIKAWNNFGCI